MAKPKFEKIIKIMERGKDFVLSAQQYREKTGADFPKNKSYAENESAAAKVAAEYGFRIRFVPAQIYFERI